MTQLFSINKWAENHAVEKMKSKENQALGHQEQIFQGRRYQFNYLQTALNIVKITTVALVAIGVVLAMKALFVAALLTGFVGYQIQKQVNSLGARTDDRPDNYVGSELHHTDVRAWMGLPHQPKAAKAGDKAPEAWTPTHSVLGLDVWHRTADVSAKAVYEKSDEAPSNVPLDLLLAMHNTRQQLETEVERNQHTEYGAGVRDALNLLKDQVQRVKHA